MADGAPRAAELGAQLEIPNCLDNCQKRSPDAKRQPFSGKSFYLDLPAGRNLQILTSAIQQLGGVIEGFLSKEVSCIVSSRKEAKAENHGIRHGGCSSPSEASVETQPPASAPKGASPLPALKPGVLVPMTRGKELLQKAIRNQGSNNGGGGRSCSSLLANARSWGVRILHVEEMMTHIHQLSLAALRVKKQKAKKSEGTRPAAESRTRKVARLKAPFLKVEDESRNFRPFLYQFKSFPEISFLGSKEASPFEALTTRGSSHHPREPGGRGPSPPSTACTTPRKRKGYCECCREAFEELQRHLQSAKHRAFALEARPYAQVDCVIAQLGHPFADVASQSALPRQPVNLTWGCDPLGPEILLPRTMKEDTHQAPAAPEQDGTVDNRKASDGMTLDPGAADQELEGLANDLVDAPGMPVSRSPVYPGIGPNSSSANPSSGPDLALVGHKRKIQFPDGNAEKKPGTSVFVPCGTWTASGGHLSPLLPGQEPKSLALLQASSSPQTCLCIPDCSPWQLTNRPVDIWTTQLPQLGGDWPPGAESSEHTVMAPGKLTSVPAAPQFQAPCKPTCNQLPECSPQEALQGAGLPLSPAAPDASGFSSGSLSPGSSFPSAAPAKHSCDSLEARSPAQDQIARDSRAHRTGTLLLSAACPTSADQTQAGPGASAEGPEGAPPAWQMLGWTEPYLLPGSGQKSLDWGYPPP